MKKITVVIPTYNRGAILSEALPTYWNQIETEKIIVIDDGSTDGGKSILKATLEQCPIDFEFIRLEERRLQQTAKNIGAQMAKTPFVFIGEDDVFLEKDHFDKLLKTMEDSGADIVAGRRVFIRDGQSQKEALEEANEDKGPIFVKMPFEGYFERYMEGIAQVKYLHTNALMKKEIFVDINYDPGYTGNAFREELDFYLQCLRKNKKMVLTAEAVCFHMRSKRKMRSGSQAQRLKYEFYVWRNTIRCFYKNADIFRSEFGMRYPTFYGLACLIARYFYAIWKRVPGKKS